MQVSATAQTTTSGPPPDEFAQEKRFNYVEDTRCRDAGWSVAFIIQLIVMLILTFVYAGDDGDDTTTGTTPAPTIGSSTDDSSSSSGLSISTSQAIGCVFLCIFYGILSSLLWLFIIKTFSKFLIWFSVWFCFGILVLCGLVLFAAGNPVGGIIFFIFAGIQALWIYCVRDRIAFASVMLKLAVVACNELYQCYYISVFSTFVQAVWMIIWMIGYIFVLKAEAGGFIQLLFILCFYWTAQVIANVVFVTTSGSVATWYFLYPNNKPESPVRSAFRRAYWNSFGSICYGSFIIAVIQTLRYMVESSRNSDNGILKCIIACLLSCIQNIMEYFNVYAFATVAIYGYTYCEAAKSTWQLFKSKGFDAIINDDLIGNVLVLACLFAGGFAGIFMGLTVGYGMNGDVQDLWLLWAIIAFFIGYGLTLCIVITVRAGVATLFVCWSNDPKALAVSKPNEYNELSNAWRQRYPQIMF